MSYTLFSPDPDRPWLEHAVRAGGNPMAFHQQLPGYSASPLYDCPPLAEALGVGSVLVKDESHRLGLPSFKMLGASWATARAISRHWLEGNDDAPVLDQLSSGLGEASGRRLAAATDGNHGRGVARMAAMLGLGCRIFVPAGTAEARIRDIEAEGATVEVVDGSYDDAITRSAQEAATDCLVISDTSWDGYTETPADVIRGYSTMFAEIDRALAGHSRPAPDVLGLQAGVGSFAAAGLGHYCPPGGGPRPRTVVVEPESANCLMRSARAGAMRAAPGPHASAMAGLNCGLPSQLAWPVVANSTDAYVAIDDAPMYVAMRLLAGIGIVAGESGASSLGGMLAVTDDAGRARLGLHAGATVLLVNTEGATDPANYREHVGEDPAEVAQLAAARRAKSRVAAL